MKTLRQNIEAIEQTINKNQDWVGGSGIQRVEIHISFLNMVGLIVKFFFALFLASPIIAIFIGFIYFVVKTVSENSDLFVGLVAR